jgi:hypothetical protein
VTRQEAAVMSPKSMALRRAVDALLKSSRPKKKVKRG